MIYEVNNIFDNKIYVEITNFYICVFSSVNDFNSY